MPANLPTIHRASRRGGRFIASRLALLVALLLALIPTAAPVSFLAATAQAAGPIGYQYDMTAPAGTEHFGSQIVVLANGNVVITDPYLDVGGVVNAGGVFLYDGASLGLPDTDPRLISRLTGSSENDYVGNWRIMEVGNSNFIVRSPDWANGDQMMAGAVTWVNGTTGLEGQVSAVNSLVGATFDEHIGRETRVLANGNYVVISPNWSANTGAITWGSGDSGVTGVVSSSNSVVGGAEGDSAGNRYGFFGTAIGFTELTNGNFVVVSSHWNAQRGAVTWFDGEGPPPGLISAANSLVGDTPDDQIGMQGVTALSNGNYVVSSPFMDGLKGAATWGNGATGTFGSVAAAQNILGTTAQDGVSFDGVTALSNGNYVVKSSRWNQLRGAATWGNGASGSNLDVDETNSLVGTEAGGDHVGSAVTALSNGNYVVISPEWDEYFDIGDVTKDKDDVGAITWGNGAVGTFGEVSSANSLVGANMDESLGDRGVYALAGNGNFVVVSPTWKEPGQSSVRGAAVWSNGATGQTRPTGIITTANSLHGTDGREDQVGIDGVTVLSSGNYVVQSGEWYDERGALTWGDGDVGLTGEVSATNSLVGADAGEFVGVQSVVELTNGNFVAPHNAWNGFSGAAVWMNADGSTIGNVTAANSLHGSHAGEGAAYYVVALTDGNYVVTSEQHNGEGIEGIGAVAWGNGETGTTGAFSAANSIIGVQVFDQVGYNGTIALPDGNFYTHSEWVTNDYGAYSGAITFGAGSATTGPISVQNSVFGRSATNGDSLHASWNDDFGYLLVGLQAENRVTVFFPDGGDFLLSVTRSGSGAGKVTAPIGGLDCGFACAAGFPSGKSVTLTATPEDESILFAGWSGACTGTALTCTVVMDQARAVTATFLPKRTLAVTKPGTGVGTVTSSPAGINCGGDCTQIYGDGTSVTLTAVPALGNSFAGWSGGACTGSGDCVLDMNADKSATATFTLESDKTLTVAKSGAGSGTVTSEPAGINCGSECSNTYVHGTSVTLTASPAAESVFNGWSGACSGSATTCTLDMVQARSVTAIFGVPVINVDVIITPSDPAAGTVQVEVVPAVSGASAETLYPVGTQLKLTAVPNSGFTFGGWTGDLTGTQNPATIVVDGPLAIGATFTATGSGGGTTVWLPSVRN